MTSIPPHRPPATLTLIGISIVVYLAMTYLDRAGVMRPLLISEFLPTPGHPDLPEIRAGEVWRLLTPVFLHFGLFHVVFNLLWLWELGRLIETRHGALGLLALVAFIGVVSNLAQYHAGGPGFGGMSGVVYGCFGYLWIQGRFNPAFGMRLNPPVVYLLMGWFVLCWSGLLELLFGLRIANTAHTAGLLCGIVPGFLLAGIARLRWR